MLEVNLLAIARLRPQLRVFNVCADCVMTLQYGHLHMNHQFVEDEDGNDAFIQYGICTNSIQTMVRPLGGGKGRIDVSSSSRLDKSSDGHGIR